MKRFLVPVLVFIVLAPTEKAFSLFGVGAYYVSDPISVAEGTDGTAPIMLVRNGFDGARGGGLFIYVDALPFIDLEANIETGFNKYQFEFDNAISELPPVDFGWARVSTYLTARKKVVGFGVPVLGGARINAGGGYNFHSSTPLADLDMVKELLGGNLTASFEADDLEDNLVDYLKENKIDGSGFHLQAGIQAKLLTLNLFVNYRLTFAKDVVPDESSFSSLWAGLAFGM
ncbi:MAG: hypothetical protein V3U24_04295 [Candidatus Neomarinimicrobiota bacterium]